MKKKFFIAASLALVLVLMFTSLALAAVQSAHVEFTTDAPCAVTILVTSYTDPANQSGQTASGWTPWTLDAYPSTAVTFFYPASVVCSGTTYDFVSVSPSSPLISGDVDITTTVVGHYAPPVSDSTPPVWTVPASFSVEAVGPAGAVATYTALASDPDDAVSSQSCSPASGTTFALGTTTVDCTATDTHGNTGTASFNVTVMDTTPPALTLPSDITVTALNESGASASFTASANDLVDGSVAVVCAPVSGSIFPIGKTTVNCSAADSRGNSIGGSFIIAVQYAAAGDKCDGVSGHQILQPINMDGSSIFKSGRTVPARFRVCGSDGTPIGDPGVVASFRLIQVISKGTVSNVDQAVPSTSQDTAFRSGNRQWIFNINTKDLVAGNTYVYLITLNDGSAIQFQFSLK